METPAAPKSDLVRMDAGALALAIARREVSCVEVMTATLDHIEAVNPSVNAIVALRDRPALLEEARAKDEAVARGDALGPLHGLPQAPKDLQPVKGILSTSGSPIFKDFVPDQDSLMVARLRDAGAILIGKTNTPEFGLGSHTYNPVHGLTRNPYAPALSAGGSSGGAAAALALRMLPVADGSDYGGSLRNPAGWNNVFGFRPSFGLVPSPGDDVWTASMGVLGPMARSVPDLALLLAVQAGYSARAPLSVDSDPATLLAPLEADMTGKRIAWLGDFGGFTPCEPGVLAVCEDALKAFTAIGCEVEPALPKFPLPSVWEAFIHLRWQQTGGALARHYADPAKRALLKPEVIWEIENGRRLSAFEASVASMIRTAWYAAFNALFERYDFVVAPTAQVFPFPVEQTWPREIAGTAMSTYHEWMKGVCLISMTGCPALAVPAGFSPTGLPMGLQIIAPVRRELDCLKLAHAYDQATKWTRRVTPPLLV